MHVVLGLIVAAIVCYLLYRTFLAPSAAPAMTAPAARDDRAFAFLSNGLLFYRERGGELTQLQSTYAQEAVDRRERVRERHGWKKGTSFGIAAGGGMRSFEPAEKPALVTSAAFEVSGDLLYFLKDDNVGGLFRRQAASGNEIRVLLRQNLHPDSAPAWIPGVPNRLLFQSSGLARNEQGYIVTQGPAGIEMLDMESGTVKPVLKDAGFDYLKPRVCPTGNLLFIRRPYEGPRYGVGSVLTDTLLFPFRLLRAVFHYLNFFSLMYTRKPLTSASGPAMQADLKNILLQGRRIDAQKALRSERAVQGVPSLVPNSWELVSRNRDGDERVLATNVATYDVGADGTIIYSNGRGVFVLGQDGAPRLAVTGDLVADVVAAIPATA